jgi:hypothetical protein
VKLVSIALLALLLPAGATAQNRGIFIQGGPVGDVRFAPSAEGSPGTVSSVSYFWNDINGDGRWQPGEEGAPLPQNSLSQSSDERFAPGGSVAVGVFVTPSVSLRLEGSFQGQRDSTTEYGASISTSSVTRRETAHDYIVSAGWHQGQADRISITYLAGLVFRRYHSNTTQRIQVLNPGVSFQSGIPTRATGEVPFVFTSYGAGVMAGVDVTFPLSRGFAVVPQFRMVAADNEWNLRPGVSLQWRP